MPGRNVNFAKTELYSAPNGLFTSSGSKCLLEWKDYLAVDKVLTLVSFFVGGCHERFGIHEQTEFHTMYTKIRHIVTGTVPVHMGKPVPAEVMEIIAPEFKQMVLDTLS